MANKKTKIKKTEKISISDKFVLVVSGFLVGILIFMFVSFLLENVGINSGTLIINKVTGMNIDLAPTHTFYLSANLFPIESYYSFINGTPAVAVFYGTPQSNGTECVSSVVVYPFNDTSQSLSKKPLPTIYYPEEVAKVYYNSNIVYQVAIPNGYTLLCPNIINATK